MNGIIYRLAFLGIFVFFGCKNDSNKKEINDSKNSIKDIKLITLKDTLFLEEDNVQFGEEWREYVKNKGKYNPLLVENKKFDRETEERFETFNFLNQESIEYLIIKSRIKLHQNYNTLIITTPETFILLNYNSKDELIDFLDLSKYNRQICQCTSKVYIDDKGVIHCQIGSGEPFYPFVNYKVNAKGKFEIVNQYTPPNQEKMSGLERLEYLIKKTVSLDDKIDLKSYLESDLFDPDLFDSSNSTFLDEKDIKNVLFSKNQSANGYKLFYEAVNEYTNGTKNLNILEKIESANKTLLICNISRNDQSCVIFILNKAYEVSDFKIFSIDAIPEEVNVQKLLAEK